MRGPVIKPACRKWYMAVHIITHAFGMTEDRESPSIPRVLFNLLQICELRVIEKYMNGIAWAESVNPEHFKVSTGKCSRNSMIKWSKYSSFNHCGPPHMLIGIAALPYSYPSACTSKTPRKVLPNGSKGKSKRSCGIPPLPCLTCHKYQIRSIMQWWA